LENLKEGSHDDDEKESSDDDDKKESSYDDDKKESSDDDDEKESSDDDDKKESSDDDDKKECSGTKFVQIPSEMTLREIFYIAENCNDMRNIRQKSDLFDTDYLVELDQQKEALFNEFALDFLDNYNTTETVEMSTEISKEYSEFLKMVDGIRKEKFEVKYGLISSDYFKNFELVKK